MSCLLKRGVALHRKKPPHNKLLSTHFNEKPIFYMLDLWRKIVMHSVYSTVYSILRWHKGEIQMLQFTSHFEALLFIKFLIYLPRPKSNGRLDRTLFGIKRLNKFVGNDARMKL